MIRILTIIIRSELLGGRDVAFFIDHNLTCIVELLNHRMGLLVLIEHLIVVDELLLQLLEPGKLLSNQLLFKSCIFLVSNHLSFSASLLGVRFQHADGSCAFMHCREWIKVRGSRALHHLLETAVLSWNAAYTSGSMFIIRSWSTMIFSLRLMILLFTH